MATDKLKVFLLGGHDLEMNTIKDILINLGGKDSKETQESQDSNEVKILFSDKDLKWGARLSEYKDELAKYSDVEEYEIYGIELIDDSKENGFKPPKNYNVIDHHNESCWYPSSLEQVARLLNIKLNREQEIIAANDRGYIPEMLKVEGPLGEKLSLDDLKEYRKRDREACNITEEDYKKAEDIYNKKENIEVIGSLTIINAQDARFGPLSDIHFFKKNEAILKKDDFLLEECSLHYIIHDETELCYYGNSDAVSVLAEKFEEDIEAKRMYRGRGFFGTDRATCKKERVDELYNFIKSSFEKSKELQKYYTAAFIAPERERIKESKSGPTFLAEHAKKVEVIEIEGFTADSAEPLYWIEPRSKKYNTIFYNNTEFAFIGNPTVASVLASIFCEEILAQSDSNQAGKTYFPGKSSFGISGFDKKNLDHWVEQIKQLVKNYVVLLDDAQNQSYHIFFHPFRWQCKDEGKNPSTFEEITDLRKISEKSPWKRVNTDGSTDQTDSSTNQFYYDSHILYNEKNYFYNFCHCLFYDEDKHNCNLVKHFEREKKGNESWTYTIEVKEKNKKYDLEIESINLNFYSTGVGVLVFYLSNTKYCDKEDILRINQFGRRVFPPFYNDIAERNETPASIEIKLGDECLYKDHFSYSADDYNKPAQVINDLMSEALGDNPSIIYSWGDHKEKEGPENKENLEKKEGPDKKYDDLKVGIDDRMYVLSWYYNPALVSQFHPGSGNEPEEGNALSNFLYNDNFWYRFVFVDNKWETCQNAVMKASLLDDATYTRWSKMGSLYGISRYSMVMLSNGSGGEEHLYRTMNSIYARMAEIVLVQRASLLRFSSEISKISNTDELTNFDDTLYKQVDSLNKCYIKFINKMVPLEVTAQDQGIEMYDMLHKQLRIREMKTILDSEINNLHQYVSLKSDKEETEQSKNLNIIAAIFVLPSLLAAAFSINTNADCHYWWRFVGVFISLVVMVVIGPLILKRLSKRK